MNIVARARSFFKRITASTATRGYDAAAGGYRWRDAGATPSQVSAMLAAREPIARRVRYAVGNQPLAASARKVFVGEAIGTGMGVVPMTGDPVLDGIIKAAFDAWCDRADFYGMQSFEGTQAAAAAQYFTDGEFFALLVIDPETGELTVAPPSWSDK